MDVSPGEIIHMDENGACKFPADKLEPVLVNARAMQQEEEARMSELLAAGSAAEIPGDLQPPRLRQETGRRRQMMSRPDRSSN